MQVPAVVPLVPGHELARAIGRGSYGEVWLGRNAFGTWRAIKLLRAETAEEQKYFERELRAGKLSQRPYGIARMPDLVITAINRLPANPVTGQAVTLRATVKNQGTGPNAIGSCGTPVALNRRRSQ